MERQDLPVRRGDAGPAVTDLHRRLGNVGYEVGSDHCRFSAATEAAVRRFQEDQGLGPDGVCGPITWQALIEADHRLGDRMLYHRSPMMRGDDVAALQRRLARLGFDTGWPDGIFGPATEAAVREFQHNVGVVADGVLGRETLAALDRLAGRSAGERTVIEVRETEWLRAQPNQVEGWRLIVADTGELPAIAQSVARKLQGAGASVLSLSTPDLAHQARTANAFGGDAYIGMALARAGLRISYFSTEGFESSGGRALAGRCSAELEPLLPDAVPPIGMQLPILRETRMPAVWCQLGPGADVVARTPNVARALATAITTWCIHPEDHQTEPGRSPDRPQ